MAEILYSSCRKLARAISKQPPGIPMSFLHCVSLGRGSLKGGKLCYVGQDMQNMCIMVKC